MKVYSCRLDPRILRVNLNGEYFAELNKENVTAGIGHHCNELEMFRWGEEISPEYAPLIVPDIAEMVEIGRTQLEAQGALSSAPMFRETPFAHINPFTF
jgi:hypothetical protein